jgi:RNA polymerase sigma-70 factor (ECF subfamily)
MNERARIFHSHRARLLGIAWRMLGARSDADDIVQEAYLRWHQVATQDIRSPIAFLITITTRLCLDRLRALKEEHERYIGSPLPEPIIEDLAPSPEAQREFEDEISIAFLTVLERLGPDERTVFLLHDVFDYGYPEIAEIVGKSEAACRQMVHRARPRVRGARARYSVTAQSRARLLERFLAAAGSRDREAVMKLLSEEVEYQAGSDDGKAIDAQKVRSDPGIGVKAAASWPVAAQRPSHVEVCDLESVDLGQ